VAIYYILITLILNLYTAAHCRPEERTIPWEKIEAYPQDYYDTDKYRITVPISHPVRLSSSDAIRLAEELQKISNGSSTEPFQFYLSENEEHIMEKNGMWSLSSCMHPRAYSLLDSLTITRRR
jgi:hypothetical protein